MIASLRKRRTCRSFDPSRPISRTTLEQIVAAALNSPTGVDRQSFDFYVVTRLTAIEAIGKAAYDAFPDDMKGRLRLTGPENVFYHAPAVIVLVPAREERENCVNYDLGIICTAICLAAESVGVQSGIIGLAGFCPPAKLKGILGLKTETSAIAVALGYATADWKPNPRELRTDVRWIE
jgi:nitroreductase